MNTVQRLRPEPQPLDAEWSAATLRMILTSEPPARSRSRIRRRRLGVAAGVLLASLGAGGVAVAAGVVPPFVTDAFSQLDATSRARFDVSGVKPMADFDLPDGTRYTVWRGQNKAGGSCEAIRADRVEDADDDFNVSCNDGDSAATYDWVSFAWVQKAERGNAPQNPQYFVVYGETPDDRAVEVEVTGVGVVATMPVAATTGGFGGALPDFVPAPDGSLVELRFTFRDIRGHRVATLERRG